MQKYSNRILIVAATIIEADHLIQRFSMVKETADPFSLYTGGNLRLVISGIGKINAAIAASWALSTDPCDTVINGGAAGALGMEHPLGTIYCISSVIDYDRPHLKSGKPFQYTTDTIQSMETATLATCNIPAIDPIQRQNLSAYAQLIDMEGAAVAHTCKKFGVTCHLLKYVSDTPEHVHDRDIVKNIRMFGHVLADTLESIT